MAFHFCVTAFVRPFQQWSWTMQQTKAASSKEPNGLVIVTWLRRQNFGLKGQQALVELSLKTKSSKSLEPTTSKKFYFPRVPLIQNFSSLNVFFQIAGVFSQRLSLLLACWAVYHHADTYTAHYLSLSCTYKHCSLSLSLSLLGTNAHTHAHSLAKHSPIATSTQVGHIRA